MTIENGNNPPVPIVDNPKPNPEPTPAPAGSQGVKYDENFISAIAGAVANVLQGQQPKPKEPTVDDVRLKQRQDEEAKKLMESNSIAYSELLSDFKIIMKEKSEPYLATLSNLGMEERANSLARILIQEAMGDSEQVNAMIASFSNQKVFDETSAFSVKYKDALLKLKEKQSSPFIIGKTATSAGVEISSEELEKLSNGLYDHRTKEDAQSKLNSLGILK